uniref:Uncharacterized protein n=1 Tax=Setaria italica TaxID=4555 RepID=K3ZXM0_SETIT
MADDERGRVEVWRAGLLEAALENWLADAPPRVAHNCEAPFPHGEVKDASSRDGSLAWAARAPCGRQRRRRRSAMASAPHSPTPPRRRRRVPGPGAKRDGGDDDGRGRVQVAGARAAAAGRRRGCRGPAPPLLSASKWTTKLMNFLWIVYVARVVWSLDKS